LRVLLSGKPGAVQFRSSLESILDPRHELLKLAGLIDWTRFDDAFGTHYHDRKGRRRLGRGCTPLLSI